MTLKPKQDSGGRNQSSGRERKEDMEAGHSGAQLEFQHCRQRQVYLCKVKANLVFLDNCKLATVRPSLKLKKKKRQRE